MNTFRDSVSKLLAYVKSEPVAFASTFRVVFLGILATVGVSVSSPIVPAVLAAVYLAVEVYTGTKVRSNVTPTAKHDSV